VLLVQVISELAEIIYNLGISTNQSRKLLTFLPDTSARQELHIFIGQRSRAYLVLYGKIKEEKPAMIPAESACA
jgi:hypothetical protein